MQVIVLDVQHYIHSTAYHHALAGRHLNVWEACIGVHEKRIEGSSLRVEKLER